MSRHFMFKLIIANYTTKCFYKHDENKRNKNYFWTQFSILKCVNIEGKLCQPISPPHIQPFEAASRGWEGELKTLFGGCNIYSMTREENFKIFLLALKWLLVALNTVTGVVWYTSTLNSNFILIFSLIF